MNYTYLAIAVALGILAADLVRHIGRSTLRLFREANAERRAEDDRIRESSGRQKAQGAAQ